MRKLQDRRTLVTGGSGEIGKTIAAYFVGEGARVLLVGRRQEALQRVKDDLGSSVEIFAADVGDADEIKNLMDFAADIFGRVDVLVTAAGTYGEIGALEQCDADAWMDAFQTNVWGTMLAIKLALPLLKKSLRASIITFAGGGDGPLPNFTSYAASKGAILRLTESVAKELESDGIAVNAISPGLVNSGFVRALIAAGPERAGQQKYQEALAQIEGRMETVAPDKAAALAVFLASDEARGLTGKNISAVWDPWQEFSKHIDEIAKTDVYNWRRIKPKDRGYAW